MNRARLCATVTAETTAGLRAARDAARGADLVELRLDGVGDIDVDGALAGRSCPVVVTCRPVWEGGRFDGSEEERRRILAARVRPGRRVGRSGIARRVRRARRGAARPQRGAVDARLRGHAGRSGVAVPGDAGHRGRGGQDRRPQPLGRRRRPPAPARARPRRARQRCWWGWGRSACPPASCRGASGPRGRTPATAWPPARFPCRDMIGRYRCHRVSASTAIYGVAGAPIAHSLSPVMHNAGFAEAGLDAIYVPFEAADADDLMGLVEALGVKGLSVTAPFKESILDHVVDVDPVGRRTGAVNTLRAGEGGWRGLNTDVAGLLAPLEAQGGVGGLRCCVLGAGGAARAAAVGLAGAGGAVTVCARRPERAAEVAALAGGSAVPFPPPPGSWDLLVNTTPVGTAPHVDDTPVPAERARGRRHRLRPRLQPRPDPPAARRRGGGLPHHRRPRHARGPGGAAVRVVAGDAPVQRACSCGRRGRPWPPAAEPRVERRPVRRLPDRARRGSMLGICDRATWLRQDASPVERSGAFCHGSPAARERTPLRSETAQEAPA